MSKKTLRIATRQSPLALWQAEYVKNLLAIAHTNLECNLVPLQTTGDRFLKDSLASHGGKGLFVKELERALLENEADIAVHSMKDVPINLPENLIIGACLKREDPRDAFISPHYANLAELPIGATVGTASLRRKAFIKHFRPDLKIELLRGNVNTRLQKLKDGHYDAIILAAAGLKRLGLESEIKEYLDPSLFIPAINQGILGIECRSHDTEVFALLKSINDSETTAIAVIERTINQGLGGACHIPVAGYAYLEQHVLKLSAMVGDPEVGTLIYDSQETTLESGIIVAKKLTEELLNRGGREILAKEWGQA